MFYQKNIDLYVNVVIVAYNYLFGIYYDKRYIFFTKLCYKMYKLYTFCVTRSFLSLSVNFIPLINIS